jgi:para-aminobenzoate synthetase/4-amino-4-deoxychorismate lyase
MLGDIILRDHAGNRWLGFAAPRRVIVARWLSEVTAAIEEAEREVEENGCWAVGFMSYEAASAFDPVLETHPPGDAPLVWFGIYDAPREITPPRPQQRRFAAGWEPTMTRGEYLDALHVIKEHIADGDTYQVNFTYRLRSRFEGEARDYFTMLAQDAAAHYSAFIDTGRYAVCSVSPELFLRLDGTELTSLPMKGTAPRALTASADRAEAARLRYSEKEMAENVMIVDMIRNDMGRIADTGTVTAPVLFHIERYPTVWQMTSTVTCETRARISEIMAAMFPCASVTGAPRRRTMQIIHELETTPRGVYTGTVGFMAPGRKAQFNVAIRTVVVDTETGTAEYGVGGGIVWDSTDEGEYNECLAKAEVLTKRWPEFSLLETMAWKPDEGYVLLKLHAERLLRSADYFAIPLTYEAMRDALAAIDSGFGAVAHRVRLLVARDGTVTCESQPLDESNGPVRVAVAADPIDTSDLFLYHKTTHREVYERALAQHPNADDVILWNERGEITEACNHNVVVEIDGASYTPPVPCGLLGGTYRQWMLENGLVTERVLTLDDLLRAERVWLINSVRGRRDATLIHSSTTAAQR